MLNLFRFAVFFMAMFAAPAIGQTLDESAISKLLHNTFDRPEAPLTIDPIVVVSNHAIAGWTQGDMGGRALLRRKEQSWVLILCAGDGIKSRDGLVQAGIPIQDATALERDLAAAEAGTADRAYLPQFRALALFGRRPAERVARSSSPASVWATNCRPHYCNRSLHLHLRVT